MMTVDEYKGRLIAANNAGLNLEEAAAYLAYKQAERHHVELMKVMLDIKQQLFHIRIK